MYIHTKSVHNRQYMTSMQRLSIRIILNGLQKYNFFAAKKRTGIKKNNLSIQSAFIDIPVYLKILI